ncbi:MAG: glycosyltransferase family 2 protein [Candidatus Binataceae bacterium]
MPKEDPSLLPPLESDTNKQVAARGSLGHGTETASSFEPFTQISLLNASNEFLNQEIALLETERDRLQLELNQIRQSYGWKVIDGYRRWLARMRDRHPSFSKVYESITVWGLNRVVRAEEPNHTRRREFSIERHQLDGERLKTIRAVAAAFTNRPLVKVLISIDRFAVNSRLAKSIESVRTQLYSEWELRIGVEEQVGHDIRALLANYAGDPRVKVELFPTVTDSLGEGLAEFVTFLEQHSELRADALFEVVKNLNRYPLTDLIYWDEGLEADGSRIEPFFKPDWNPDLLLSTNYLGPSFAIRRRLVEKAIGTPRNLNVNSLHDLLLRGVESTNQVVHIRKILSYRCKTLASGATESDRAGAQVVEEALERRGLRGTVTSLRPGHYSVRYEIRGQPLVSILIPTRDGCALLRRCLASIEEKTDYPNYEIILLDNGSSAPETFEFFETIADRVRIVSCPGPFNFSAINNRGAKEARGEFLLFLNNDTEVIRSGWLRAMIEQAQRPEVGAVGAKLLFPDGRIQHAGVVLGFGGPAVHVFRFGPSKVPDFLGFVDAIRDCSAVTAACLMIRHTLFNEIQGFDEELAVDFNDVDLCLRLRERGYLIVFQPHALLYHHEAATRGRSGFADDEERFSRRWAASLQKGDPYYSRDLILLGEDWSQSS